MPTGMEREPEQDPEKYSFLHEKIKDETFSWKKIAFKASKIVGLGLLFGISASISFFALKPWAESAFQRNPDEIQIPQDEETDDAPAGEQTAGEQTTQSLTIENYKELGTALNQVAIEARKSMVQIVGAKGNQNAFEGMDKRTNSTPGVIIADNGVELLILTDTSILPDAHTFWVEFVDKTQCEAILKKKDENLNLAMLSISKAAISETTWNRISVASLGNSKVMRMGKTVIALGNPFGMADELTYGIVSSAAHSIVRADGEYDVLSTDIMGTPQSRGVLFDIDGNVVGIMQPDILEGNSRNMLTAYGISAIKSEIELLSNGKDVPYIGIVGTIITKDVADAQNMPEGLYVSEVEADSPAMRAGIQNGDIITDIGDKEIDTLMGYRSAIITKEIGTELHLKGQRRGAEDYVRIEFNVTVGIKE